MTATRALTPLALLYAFANPATAAPGDLEALSAPVRWAEQDGGYWPEQEFVRGDFDGDGLTDIARIFGEADGTTSIDVLTSGDSRLIGRRWLTASGGFWAEQYYVALDADGDGRDEIARIFADGDHTSIDMILSDGQRFHVIRAATRQGGFGRDMQFTAGDFDGDGREDIARVFGDAGLTSADVFLAADAHGSARRWLTRTGGYFAPMHFVAGDVDGDGRADLARVFADHGAVSVDVLQSSGSGFLARRALTRDGAYPPGLELHAGDADGDGLGDLLLVDATAGLRADVLRATGAGYTRHPLVRAADPGHRRLFGDFDGDGRAELATIHGHTGLTDIDVFGVPAPGWEYRARPVRWAGAAGGFWVGQHHLAGDFDGDGMPDIARVFADGGLTSIDVLRSDAAGFESERWVTRQGGHWDGMQFVVGEFTGDGRDDIARIFADGGHTSIDVFAAMPGGGFVPMRWITRNGGHSDDMRYVAGEFTGDGRDDIARVFDDGGLTSIDVFRSLGGAFDLGQRAMTRVGGFWPEQRYLAGDFDGDGDDDIARVFSEATGEVSIDVLSSSAQGFAYAFTQARWMTGPQIHHPLTRLVAGDFDGDGRDDIAGVHPTATATVTVRLARSTGHSFRSHLLTETDAGFSPEMMAVAADFDLDGRAEVATIYRTAGSPMSNVDVYGGETAMDPGFIQSAGDTRRYTPAEARAALAADGLSLVARSVIGAGECTVVYPSTDALTQSRDLGLLTCAFDLGHGIELRVTPVYGGCDVSAGLYGAGAQCEIGVFATSVTVSAGPVQTELTVRGPSAALCGSVSREAVCADVGANLWDASFLVTDGDGTGGGAGVYAGVGAGVGAGYSDGVFSGSLDLGVGVGFELQYSVNLHTVVGYGAQGFAYTVEGLDAAISAAGPVVGAVRDGLDDAYAATVDGISDAVDAVSDALGDAAGAVGGAAEDAWDEVSSWF